MAEWLLKTKHFVLQAWRWLLSQVTRLSNTEGGQKLIQRLRSLDFAGSWQRLVSIASKSFTRFSDRFPVLAEKPVITAILLLLVIVGVYQINPGHSLDDLKESGELLVISRESPTTWYQDNEGPAGPEYDYLESFAEFLGVELRFDIRENSQAVLEQIAGGKGHLGAAGLVRHASLEDQGIVFGPEYQQVDQKVVCRRNNGKLPRNAEELADYEVVVVADSSFEANLFDLQEDYPDLSWDSVSDIDVEQLLEQVWRREIDCTVATSSALNIKRRIYPELQAAFIIEENQSLAWMLSPEWTVLSDAIEAWLEYIDRNGELSVLKDKHYIVEEFDYVDMRSFIRKIKSRLPGLKSVFQEAAEKHQIPWTLLAAQAYQESHWNRRAKSPTGVRGIMMLTLVTAKEMGVASRLDAKQSIMGGAKYLKSLELRIPEEVKGDDRWWYALAAYNLGMGHVHDARSLADKLDLDPDSWLDLKGVLPLLQQKKYYKELKYGFARGSESVVYVQRVRNYANILRAQIAKSRGSHTG
ncbi:MAG: membrane-bound lytic murein transglycosylase MltF [Gammaproteobacteria bacterium]|nr:membrane-bound lytic murein transglycosylase MltF [Gammaproteobacteria bacterium]